MQWRHLVDVGRINLCVVLQQEQDDVHLARGGGQVEGRAVVERPLVDVSP